MAYDFFGSTPTTVVMQTTSNFDGTAQAVNLILGTGFTKNPGLIVCDPQAGGGLMNFHHRPIKVVGVAFTDGGGECELSIFYPGVATGQPVVKLTPSDKHTNEAFVLPVGAELKAISTGTAGAKKLAITAVEVQPFNGNL